METAPKRVLCYRVGWKRFSRHRLLVASDKIYPRDLTLRYGRACGRSIQHEQLEVGYLSAKSGLVASSSTSASSTARIRDKSPHTLEFCQPTRPIAACQ